MYLGIEIGGTKLQLGLGRADGTLASLWRETVDVPAGPEGIRRQIQRAVPELLAQAGVGPGRLRAAGIGFGGPVDDTTQTIIKSHQIEGWDHFPLARWVSDLVQLPTVLGNDADVAGLAEALHGAGQGLSPLFYITVGSGLGGGFIQNGRIYRGSGRGAAEIGHLRVDEATDPCPLEERASGWGIQQQARKLLSDEQQAPILWKLIEGDRDRLTTALVGEAARQGDPFARHCLHTACDYLAQGICHVITLLCPRRIVIGGGVSLIGEELFFAPLRQRIAARAFGPFAGLTDIVPAALGEEVVVHGALALARQSWDASA